MPENNNDLDSHDFSGMGLVYIAHTVVNVF
jgi:hypothetical protein